MKELTKAEEQVMKVLWNEGHAFVKDLLKHFPDPKPAYNTISTIVRILEKKGFVDHEEFGKSHRYFPVVDKESYRDERFTDLMKGYFNNSMKQVLSHFSDSKNLDIREADELINMLEEIKSKSKRDE